MNFIKENKYILLIGTLLISVALIISFFVNNKNNESNYLKHEETNYYLKDYKINELVPVNINEEQVARKYLAEYTKLIINDPESAYNLVEPEYKKLKFNNLSEFKEYFNNKIDASFLNGNVEKLNVTSYGTYKEYYIKDSGNNTYIFREYSIMNYEVLFDNFTI